MAGCNFRIAMCDDARDCSRRSRSKHARRPGLRFCKSRRASAPPSILPSATGPSADSVPAARSAPRVSGTWATTEKSAPFTCCGSFRNRALERGYSRGSSPMNNADHNSVRPRVRRVATRPASRRRAGHARHAMRASMRRAIRQSRSGPCWRRGRRSAYAAIPTACATAPRKPAWRSSR